MQGCPLGQMLSVMTAGHQLLHLSPAPGIGSWEVWQRDKYPIERSAQNSVNIKRNDLWRCLFLFYINILPYLVACLESQLSL